MNPLASLRNRVFIASVVLAAVTLGFAVVLIGSRMTERVQGDLERSLRDAAALLEEHHGALSQLFLLRARLVADLPVLKSAVDTEDPSTVGPLAADYQRQLRADVLIVTGRDGRLLFGSGGGVDARPRLSETRALAGEEVAAFWLHGDGLLQVVTVPILVGRDVPEILGTLSAGFLLDDRRAVELKRLTAAEVAFAAGGRIHAATLPARERESLEARAAHLPGVRHVLLGDEDYLAVPVPLALPLPVADGDVPSAVVLRSRASHLQELRTIQTSLVAAAGLAVALAIVLSYIVARSVTTPLGTITAEMRDMAATGDLTRRIHLRGPSWSQDEDARLLAATLNTLTDSIARFQREAAQRDRLLSLGRLSTVIAHEVRNPLMIIKAALRPLGSASLPLDIRDAAADIDEQVERLNRIVHDVLDFARPLQPSVAPTDLSAVCHEAAAAVMKGERSPAVRVEAEPIHLVTDAERLRAALINVLVNARQAVAARDGAAGDPGEIELTAGRVADGRVRITVRDRGVGIPPDQLPHVFEPYFTTRRAGTGLGLPITRNIVEALGGAIRVQPADPGTRVEIELPEMHAPSEEVRA